MEKPKNKNNFCIRPFNSAWLGANGDLKVCCMINPLKSTFPNIKQDNIKQTKLQSWWNSDYLEYLRHSFMKNERPSECVECWKKEDNGMTSHRLRSNKEHKAIFQNKYERNLQLIGKDNLDLPEDVQMNVTNLCNLKCQMCAGKHSSKLLVENNALGYEDLDQKDFDLKDSDYQDILQLVKHDLKVLMILGGEPFFNPRVIKLLEMLVLNGQAKKIKLHVTTNGTMCNDKILSLLKEFPDLRLVFSCDGSGTCNDYMRFPSSWQVVSNNIKQLKRLKNANTSINCVVQNLNVLYVDQLIKFANENKIFIKLNVVTGKEWLHPLILPKNVLRIAHKKLSSIKKRNLIHTDAVEEIINLLKKHIDNYNLDEDAYEKFIDMIQKRDTYRNIDIKNYMPELAREIAI